MTSPTLAIKLGQIPLLIIQLDNESSIKEIKSNLLMNQIRKIICHNQLHFNVELFDKKRNYYNLVKIELMIE